MDARGNTQVSLDAYVLVDTLADKLAEMKVLTLNETLAQMKARLSPHSVTSKYRWRVRKLAQQSPR